ncbi:MAG: hypothetical protein Q7S58_08870 [Candidatus Binatus sp.]|nr:hypothetical protein [Candidatus Binatus sp.]MDO8432505.1 hypothetical protein [Candidatus Binatus sp.]
MSLAQVVAMGLGAIASRLHRAPTPRAVFALVEKEPEASYIASNAGPSFGNSSHDLKEFWPAESYARLLRNIAERT